jgi:hypothetical protein
MGAEGGCYAIRNNLFSKVPSNFIVDDFIVDNFSGDFIVVYTRSSNSLADTSWDISHHALANKAASQFHSLDFKYCIWSTSLDVAQELSWGDYRNPHNRANKV